MPVQNAIQGVHRLKQAGFDLHVVTSISDDQLTQIYRNKNLIYYFGDVFETITCLPLGHDNKKEYYQNVPISCSYQSSISQNIMYCPDDISKPLFLVTETPLFS